MGHIFTLSYKTSAFEMLKSSGSMKLIRNKALSRAILDCYSNLETIKYDSDNYMVQKREEIMDAYLSTDEDNNWFTSNKRIIRFFANYVDNDKVFRECAEQLEETLALF